MRRTLRTVLAVLALSMIALPALAATSTVIVSDSTTATENDPGQWFFNRDTSTSSPYAFEDGPSTIGDGSLYVLPIGSNAADKFIGEYFAFTAMADITSFTYDFLIGGGGAAADDDHFYLNVYANFGESDADKFYDCRYNIVPSTGSTSDWTTVKFDPTASYPVTTRGGTAASPYTCPASPAAMDGLSPGSTVRAFALNVGDTSANDVDLDGYLDKVVFTTTSDTTVFDFGTKSDCKKSGWQGLTRIDHSPFKNQGQCIKYVNTGK